MAVVIGIDEAGLGPAMGPMVVSAVAMSVPDEHLTTSLWQLLAGAVSRKSTRKSPVAIDDSKKIYSSRRAGGIHALERGVLSALAAIGCRPTSLTELLKHVAPRALTDLTSYPWYASEVPLPRSVEPTDVTLAGNALATSMAGAGVSLLGLRAEPVLAGQFNRLVAATRNKSTTLFDVTARHLDWAWRTFDRDAVHVCADRHGGRRHYRPALERVFEGCRLRILDESETSSGYQVTQGDRVMTIRFNVSAETSALAVALASMISKYLRELFMLAFNAFWQGRVPDLTPTAGYHPDGGRFFKEIEPAFETLGVDRSLIWRTR